MLVIADGFTAEMGQACQAMGLPDAGEDCEVWRTRVEVIARGLRRRRKGDRGSGRRKLD